MKNLTILIFSIFTFTFSSFAQTKKIKVYLLGTFHFNQVDTLLYDINDEKHQKSIENLSNIITGLKRIRPMDYVFDLSIICL